METYLQKKSNKNGFDDGIYFWSPALEWRREEDMIYIGVFAYDDIALDVFPEFYYYTQDGITIETLKDKFRSVDSEKFINFVKELVKNRILINTLLNPQEVFYQQAKVIPNQYEQDTFLNPYLYKEFKAEKLSRSFKNTLDTKIKLIDSVHPSIITQRKSYRKFNEKEKISFDKFSEVISVFRQYKQENEIRYNYGTDGGLYPIDLFIYMKDQRVENIKSGLYYYNPIKNELELVSSTCVITESAHYSLNKEIFESSAFSIFLIYNGEVTLPKYGGMGYFYAAIDSGIMVQLLTQVCEMNNIGICSIGEMNFNKVKKYYKLDKSQVLLHSIEVGLKLDED